jgi:hypothetical protein
VFETVSNCLNAKMNPLTVEATLVDDVIIIMK